MDWKAAKELKRCYEVAAKAIAKGGITPPHAQTLTAEFVRALTARGNVIDNSQYVDFIKAILDDAQRLSTKDRHTALRVAVMMLDAAEFRQGDNPSLPRKTDQCEMIPPLTLIRPMAEQIFDTPTENTLLEMKACIQLMSRVATSTTSRRYLADHMITTAQTLNKTPQESQAELLTQAKELVEGFARDIVDNNMLKRAGAIDGSAIIAAPTVAVVVKKRRVVVLPTPSNDLA